MSYIPSSVVPLGALSSGVVGNADLSVPVNRVNLDLSIVNARRPFPAYGQIFTQDFEGRSLYHSLQLTLSRQTGKRLQYLAAYTLSKTQGTLRGEYLERDPFDPARTYGVLDEDRRHIFNLSWNALLPDGSRNLDNAFGRIVLGGWQLSGISTFTSGAPIRLWFSGDAAGNGVSQAYFGTPDVVGPAGGPSNGLAPAFVCDPRRGGSARWGETPRHRLHQGAGLRDQPTARPALRHADACSNEPRSDDLQEFRPARQRRSCSSVQGSSTSSMPRMRRRP